MVPLFTLVRAGPGRYVRLALSRGPGPDFSERDRAVLRLLGPHLDQAYLDAGLHRRPVPGSRPGRPTCCAWWPPGIPTPRSPGGWACPREPCAPTWRTSTTGCRFPAAPPPSPAPSPTGLPRAHRQGQAGVSWSSPSSLITRRRQDPSEWSPDLGSASRSRATRPEGAPSQGRGRARWPAARGARHLDLPYGQIRQRRTKHQAPTPPTIHAGVLPATAVNVIGPLSAAYAEPDNLRTLTAVIDTSARRAESAIWPPQYWVKRLADSSGGSAESE